MTPRTTGRIAFAAVAVAALVGTQSCRKPEAESCPTGIFCPAGWHCAAKAAQCIKDLCGNGKTDPLETCDDGGAKDADLIDEHPCSADCKWEERCGNGHVEEAIHEACDPPEEGVCSDDCMSSLVCGNHQTDPGEDCDPGENNVPLETTECDLDCTDRKCGDGTVNHAAPAEQCDRDGDGVAGDDGQSRTCNRDCTSSRCGDGKTNSMATVPAGGEQCDDGESQNGWNAKCLPTCIKNECGDTHLNQSWVNGARVEDCDSGAADAKPHVDCPYSQNEKSCTLCSVCKWVQGTPHYCGDGEPDAQREACDKKDHNGDDASSCIYGNARCELCSADCQNLQVVKGPTCGDGDVKGGWRDGEWYWEGCDDGASTACGTCSPQTATLPCRNVDRKAASGRITVTATEGLPGVTFALSDDVAQDGLVFEYVAPGGTAAGTNVAIQIGADAPATATSTATAISDSDLAISVSTSGAALTLTHERVGIVGNVPIEVTLPAGLTASPLEVTGMAGGVGCGKGVACSRNEDCVSNNCSTSRHVCN